METLLDAAYDHSLNSMVARHNLRAAYWEYRTYQAKRLPSLNLSGTVAPVLSCGPNHQDAARGKLRRKVRHTLVQRSRGPKE